MTRRASRPGRSIPILPKPARYGPVPITATRCVRASLALLVLSAAACGKKGPPLMPLPSVPQQVLELTARRLNDEVYLRFKIPTTNVTGEKPADIRSVVVYGFTGRPTTNEDFIKYGALVAEVPVRKPPPPPPPVKEGEPPPPPLPPPVGPGLNQGDYAVVLEKLTPETLVPIVTKAEQERLRKAKPEPVPVAGPLLGPASNILLRSYVVVGLNHRGRKGAYSARAVVPLLTPPPAPAAPTVTYTARTFTVGWVRPDGARIAAMQATTSTGTSGTATPETPGSSSGAPVDQIEPDADSGAAQPATQGAAARKTPAATDQTPTGQSPKDTPVPALPSGQPPPPPAEAPAAQIAAPPQLPATSTSAPPRDVAESVAGSNPAVAPSPNTPAPSQSSPTTQGATTPIPFGPPLPPPAVVSRPLFPVFPASAYNVYEIVRVTPSDAGSVGVTSGAAKPMPPAGSPPDQELLQSPVPLNPQPISTESFEDARLEFGTERCYVVRTVNTFGAFRIESAASDTTCTVPVDTFAPGAPKALAAVGSESAIDLIWEPNSESDLAGYLVLRGAPGDETLQRLTPEPIRQTTYRDSSVRRGVRYAYIVVAVDKATPANISAPSVRVEETAR